MQNQKKIKLKLKCSECGALFDNAQDAFCKNGHSVLDVVPVFQCMKCNKIFGYNLGDGARLAMECCN